MTPPSFSSFQVLPKTACLWGRWCRVVYQSQWIKDDWTFEQIKKTDFLSNLVVNKRGDTVLHLVASCGRWKPFQCLILDHGVELNLKNSLGETPLLCACRAGHGGIAYLCLQRYKADASIAANNGVTLLYWLYRCHLSLISTLNQSPKI